MSDPDDLRRRLYRPDASPEDLERYRAARPRRRPRLLVPALLVAAALVGVVLLTRIDGASRPEARPTSSTTITAPTVTAAPPAPPGGTLTIPASDRAAFVRALQAGRSMDLLHYLLEHPDARPPIIRTVSRADSEEHAGVGTTVITLDPSSAAARGGRITLVLTLDRPLTAALTLDHVDPATPQGLATKLELDPVHPDAGLPVVVSLEYEGRVPNQVLLTVPPPVHWDLVADFTD